MATKATTGTTTNASGSGNPFAKLKQMLREGRIGPGSNLRRYIPGLKDTSDLSWEEMAEIGNQGLHAPPMRRSRG